MTNTLKSPPASHLRGFPYPSPYPYPMGTVQLGDAPKRMNRVYLVRVRFREREREGVIVELSLPVERSQGAFPFIWVRFYKQAPGALDVGQQFGRRVEDHDVEEAVPG